METKSILILDDDPDFKNILSDTLKANGYRPITAATGKEALDRVKEERPALALIDLRLVDMSGLEVLREIKECSPATECIMITGCASQASAAEAVNLGAYSYLQKPYDLGQLLLVIQRAIEKEEAEEALRVSEERYRTIFNQAADSIVLIDAESGALVEFNERAHENLGYTCKEFEKLKITDFETIESSKKVARHIKKIVKAGADTFETKHRTKAGEIRDIRVNARAVSIRGKNFVQSIWHDITELKRAAEALQESEKRFRTFVDFTYDWESWIGPDGKYIYVSPSCERISGYSSEEFFKNPGLLQKISHPDDHNKVCIHIQKHQKRDEVLTMDFRIITRSGDTRWISHICRSVYDNDGNRFGRRTCNRDVTDQRKLEAQLHHAQKMESIGTLAGGIAHDFNNILYSIIGFAEMGADKSDENSKIFRYFREILRAGNRGSGLTKNILAFCRQEELDKKPSLIQPVIKESLEMLSAVIPSTIKIDRRIDMQCGPVLCDPAQIQQVIVNLCTNAYQAMQDTGGNLVVALSEVDIEPGYHISLKPGTYLQLTVGDDGHGISAEDMKRIFDPYFTTKEKGKGTGLGLSVVHGIVKNHEGEITVSSEPGKGSTFNVYLPRIIDDSGEEEGVRTIPESIPGGKENILLVDDEPTIVDMLTEFLEGIGYHVTAHTGSVKALEAFRLQPEKFDVVITDMTMPEMPGDRLSQKLLEIRPDIPIIICTGFSERVNEEQAKAMGIREFIMKPAQRGKLARLIRKVMED